MTERPLKRTEYEQLVEFGAFHDEKIELVYGRLVQMSPQGRAHAYALMQLDEIFQRTLNGRARVRVQAPFAAANESLPEPDVAIVPSGDYLDAHPSVAHLIIEVAESSLAYDRATKAALYASSGVPEYWIVNLVDGAVELHRDPRGDVYAVKSRHERGAALAVPPFADVVVQVADILPPA